MMDWRMVWSVDQRMDRRRFRKTERWSMERKYREMERRKGRRVERKYSTMVQIIKLLTFFFRIKEDMTTFTVMLSIL